VGTKVAKRRIGSCRVTHRLTTGSWITSITAATIPAVQHLPHRLDLELLHVPRRIHTTSCLPLMVRSGSVYRTRGDSR